MQNKTFIHQLHAILQQPELERWIRWEPDEQLRGVFSLRPHDAAFSTNVLKRYFKHGNVSSFVRQLHMYGFHKLAAPTAPTSTEPASPATSPAASAGSSVAGGGTSSADGSAGAAATTAGTKSGKSAVVWQFSHPSGAFCRDSTMSELGRIQRKSGGVGKNGKRKNVLSAVCVNYVDTTAAASIVSRPSSAMSGSDEAPQMTPLPSLRPLTTPAPPESARSPSSPDLLSQKGSSGSSNSVPQLSALYPGSTPVPAGPQNLTLQHLQHNINLIQRGMVTILDVLQQFPPQSSTEAETISATLQALRNDIISADTKWTHLRYPIVSAHSSFSSVGSSFSNAPPGSGSRFPSLSTQKSSVFSNTRFSNASIPRSSSSGQSTTDNWGLAPPHKKK
ncbi:Mga1p [Lachancea thermotolerans CBS 6340]|uniref:KLTH0H00814p n=1 Tax=Lachancea thermotolerans (strain ATCC 56472 / CBS 6340 / NRRL Y-8284) TaxID=559295 RepID=C5E1Z2_LACTC|nr:KLTH0H00814p [Lachancea thermotolerans CBS 6340]CAR30053.1 KLTH0H00814p [Lachancea thermotolerans CBS 6340]